MLWTSCHLDAHQDRPGWGQNVLITIPRSGCDRSGEGTWKELAHHWVWTRASYAAMGIWYLKNFFWAPATATAACVIFALCSFAAHRALWGRLGWSKQRAVCHWTMEHLNCSWDTGGPSPGNQKATFSRGLAMAVVTWRFRGKGPTWKITSRIVLISIVTCFQPCLIMVARYIRYTPLMYGTTPHLGDLPGLVTAMVEKAGPA